MDQFNERLARLSELSGDELDTLESEMVAAFDSADASGDLAAMEEIADALDQVRGAKTADAEPAAEAPAEEAPVPVPASVVADATATAEVVEAPEAEAATPAPKTSEAPVEPVAAEAVTEPEPVAEAAAPDAEPETPAEPEAVEPEAAATEEAAEAVAEEAPSEEVAAEAAPSDDAPAPADAAEAEAEAEEAPTTSEPSESEATMAPAVTAADVPEEARPVEASVTPYTIRAGGDIPGVTAGSELVDMDAVSAAMAAKLDTMRGVSSGQRTVIASIRVEGDIPDERMLRPGDAFGNARKIRDLLSNPEALRPEALTAAGWCAPRAPIYDVPTLGTTRRPVRDSLPTFTADRGGAVWMEPPSLPQLTGVAVSLWRHDGSAWNSYLEPDASDNAADEKPCYTVECGDEKTADVDAIPVCLCFDNLAARAFPEWIRANTDLTMVAQARFAEQVALAQMFGIASTGSCGTPQTSVGVARDFLLTVRAAAASLRWRLRLDTNAPLQVLAPSWVGEAIAVDLGLQAPGDNTLSLSLAIVSGYFNEFNVDPIWYIDDAPGTDAFDSCSFPSEVHWLLYPTGSFMRLDNGELNLGVTRSKEDLQANRYCEFAETFETVAYMGPAISNGWVIRGLTDINVAGSYALGTDTNV